MNIGLDTRIRERSIRNCRNKDLLDSSDAINKISQPLVKLLYNLPPSLRLPLEACFQPASGLLQLPISLCSPWLNYSERRKDSKVYEQKGKCRCVALRLLLVAVVAHLPSLAGRTVAHDDFT